MSELAPGVVTIADLYRELVGMRTDVGKALTRIEVIDNHNNDADKIHGDHELRLRMLEAFRWKLAGIAMSVGMLSGAGGTVLGWLLTRK